MSDETTPGAEKTEPQVEATPRAEAPAKPATHEPKRITIDRFFETDLRVAQIISAERIPDADRLLKLQVDLGDEQRQVVAGIAMAYEPEQLVGRHVIVVANLKPARLRGVESQGMLLAADYDGKPLLATFDADVAPGTKVR